MEAPSHRTVPAMLKQLGRYRIIRPLSKGGMALVYEARRESLAGVSPRVAIKLILPNYANKDSFQELFINEARLGASMHHQNLVQIQDFDRDGDRFFLVMEYVEGLTLRRLIALSARHDVHVPLGVIAEIGRQACDGLHYAHQAADEHGRKLDLVHRDIKPSNLILSPHGVVKVLDFGISKGRLMRERKGAVRGTWGYMAPEQARGEDVGPPSDVFGLGAVLYELAAGKPVFTDKPPDEIKRLLMDDHAARMATQLDPAYGPLIGVLVRALQRSPGARYTTASDFGRSLSGLLPDPITARDEVTRFYEIMDALREGRPVKPSSSRGQSSGGSLSSPPSTSRGSAPLILASLAAAVVGGGVLLLAGGLAVLGPWLAPSDPGPERPVLSGAPSAVPSEPEERPPPAVQALPREPQPEPVAPAPVEEPAAEVVVVRTPQPSPPPLPQPEVEAPSPEPPPAPGRLTLATAQPGSEIYIDGEYVRTVPLTRYELPSGSHVVTLVATDGRRKTFEIEVPADDHIRRLWDFDRGEFRR